ncbi:ABC transporter ATP-binding protein [bacteria symbiont BFo1 of Frankliniella occidentalis]|jgi:putative ABC transport system ATP-binding protein|uniref:iron efflux ABC transporter ATP-binding subunit FetA n=1 Tax=Erwinia aphidicola TaxID=68334 RepID=UPI0006645104|nr:ATP-binding cassette domain-containing protein [Erwinia aphidicola]KMV69481.1 ABC transporter ATP-binding protein [bacteria symbiont BFo1 of Frankliniella occidentalis]KYP83951.1 ABC transporter ATP-binding protein [bacteria symbiont BFo1 of Frankliniella occidentalis]KYP89326.1 ABC transporter ATP-binding protein [bacteria symbiont BFo1 of Frankliniella occidentalis]CAH0253951.1 putative iron export ATP-binding protein FetA [Erwinia aphidicola]
MTTTSPLLQVREVSFALQEKMLLAPLSFELHSGEFLWLTGPSGAGKSTLLKIIASLLEPSAGEVRFNGKPLADLKVESYRQRVSYVFQTPQLFGSTVYDNLALPYQIRQRSADRARMIEWLSRVNLAAELLDKPIDQLSGGEKQRVALLRNLQFPPDILLLDEITSALDEENKQRVQQLIDRQVEQGCAAIWISHDPHEIGGERRVLRLEPAVKGEQHEPA